MILLIFTGVNAVIFNMTIGHRTGEWDLAPKTPWQAKAAGTAAGRAIAYVLPPPM
jgi:hypothetical protein